MSVILPADLPGYGLRLVAYVPNEDKKLGLLPFPLSFEAAAPLNDVSSLRLDYSSHAPGADLLAQPCEIALEYLAGGDWVEPPGGRFLRIKRGSDVTDQAGKRSYTCPGYAWAFKKAVLYPTAGMVDGKRQFNAVPVGAVLRTLIDEAKARGALEGMTAEFSSSTDSNHQAWATKLTIALDPGVDLLTLLLNLSDQGVIDWRMRGRALEVFNEGTVMACDRSAGPALVDLRLGRDVDQAPDDATLEDLSTAILIAGENGFTHEIANDPSASPWGRWETYQQQGGVSDAGTAAALGQAALSRASGERVQITRAVVFDEARWLPWANYAPGDKVLAPGDGGRMEPLRIRQVTLSRAGDGKLSGNLVLNDRFLEDDIKLARKSAGILAGGVSSGGSGTTPAPDSSGRVPAPPPGLIVEPDAYLDTTGYAQGIAVVTWGPVTADVNGVALDVDGYEVYARPNAGSGLWYLVAQTASGDVSASVSPLNVDSEYAFKVRAVGNDGTKGVFSAPVAVLVPNDPWPPPVPSAPTLTTRLGVIHVAWDGLGAGGVVMPIDFERVRVWMQDPLAPGAAEVGYLTAAGVVVIPDQPYGKPRAVWLTAVDRSGNESAATSPKVIATAPLVDADLIGQVIDGAEHIIDGTIPGDAKITADSITGRLIRALAIEADKIAANAITADKVAAGAIQASHVAANAIEADKVAANAITADKISANAITAAKIAADAINGKTITGGTITGAYLRTASSGQRIEVAPPGASLPEIRFTSSSGGQASITAGGSFGTGIEIVGSADSFGRRFTLVQSASLFEVKYRYSGSSQANGGFMELRDSGTKVGWYGSGIEDENYFEFSDYGYGPRTTHIGRWNHLSAGPRWGILTGRLTVGDGYGGMRINYPTTLMTVPNPVAGVKHAVDSVPNFRWCLSNNTFSSFDVDWQVDPDATNRTNYGKEVFFWIFRT
ncbi:fibronectin type III domain-containing protein [Nonomuraea sp. B19D2]|uniref:fibronectin type III domain-containing protein n=1 Tax=Nonomuraea sp. B19D2 TaxID=3159561 RepID=UPI0032DAA522